uniref:Bifunctional inhibitor/plant lipid transfer protein/seed storage helical domain-containing protein n=1 Tax=Kalanchoe fedtschenkoi TaxID=63787 RepID=A0A7N0UVZ6_KALFE
MGLKLMGVVGLVALLVVFTAGMGGMASAAPTAAQCKEMRRLGVNACKSILNGAQPSAECCHRIRVTPIQCVCSVVTPEIAVIVRNFPRFYQMIQSCGRRVPRHYKCGSITTP